jgi:hypothetical protein
MSRRNQIALLTGLALLFVYVLYRNFQTPAIAPTISRADESFAPIKVDNPALRLDLLDHMKTLEYQGSHRNIFSAAPPPPPPAAVRAPVPVLPAAPAPPPGPPPLVVPATFYGYVTDAQTGTRRAFFSQGEDVFVVGVGDILLGRFRLIQIGNNAVELEETSTGRRVTQVMEEQGAP